ncbi:MAG: glycosyltransferase [Lapillicoccus sp.]
MTSSVLVERARVEVCAVLVVRNGARWLEETLDSLATSSLLPDRLVVVDLGSSDASLDLVRAHSRIRQVVAQVDVVPLPTGESTTSVTTSVTTSAATSSGTLPFGAAVREALTTVGPTVVPDGREWLWFLHADSAPAPQALSRLVTSVGRSPSVGVAGPKIVSWGDPRRLVSMGDLVTRAGRRLDAPAPGEPDQGQYDGRTDVLAVSTNGMFVRRDVYDELGGLDDALGEGAGLDFGWRAQLAGHRVIVVPAARVSDATLLEAGSEAVTSALLTSRPLTASLDAAGGAGEAGAVDESGSVDESGRVNESGNVDESGSVNESGGSDETGEGLRTAPDPSAPAPAVTGVPPARTAPLAPAATHPTSATPDHPAAPVDRPHRTARGSRRRAARRVALTRCALWSLPFLAVWVVVSSVLSAAALLALKRPAHAWAELGDVAALTHPVTGIRSRWRFRGHRRVRRADLDGVFVSSGAALAHTWDSVQEALTPERSHRRSPELVSGATETGPVAEEAEDLTVLPASIPQRILTHPGTVAVVLALAVTVVVFWSGLRGGLLDPQGAGLAGGELRPVSTDAAGLWHLFRDAWHGAGFGTDVAVGPQVGVLAALTWLAQRLPSVADGRSPAGVTVAWLMLAAMPLSALTAYAAGRVATLSRWPRAIAALAWGTSAGLAAALVGGRLSIVVAHILLPLVIAGFGAVTARRATWTSTFATGLATALVGCFVPVLAVVACVAAIAMVLLARGARWRSVVLALVPPMLYGPWVLQFVHDPRLLLTGGGLLDAGGGATPPWQTAMGQPDGAGLVHSLLFAPLALAACLALGRMSRRDRRSPALTGLAVLALVGLAVALAAPRVTVGQVLDDGGQPVVATLWSGVGVEVYVAALLAAYLVGWQGLSRRLGESRWGAKKLGVAVASFVLAVSVLGAGALTARNGLGDRVGVGRDALPAVAVDQSRGVEGNRLLILRPTVDRIDYRLVGAEPGPLQRDVIGPVATDPGLAPLVGALATGVSADASGPGAGARLADQGVGFVSLRADAASPLSRTLDAESGLTRLGTTDDQTLWRVLARTPAVGAADETVPPSRVRVADAAGAPLLGVPVDGPHGAVNTTLPSGAAGRQLVVAEAPEWARVARVTYDDTPLTAVSGSGFPTYTLPATGGRLVIDLPPAQQDWFLLQLVLLVVVVFLAIPFGTRRSRRRA